MSKLIAEIENLETFAKFIFVRDLVMGGFPDEKPTWDTLTAQDKTYYMDEAKESFEYKDMAPAILEDEIDAIIEYLAQ